MRIHAYLARLLLVAFGNVEVDATLRVTPPRWHTR